MSALKIEPGKSPVGDASSTSTALKAISLWQPWASLIPLGLKHYETRSWKTSYRGKLLICSTAKETKAEYQQYLKICDEVELPPWNETNFLLGCAIAVCELVDCIKMTTELIAQQSATEILCGDWQVDRYAWKLENIQPIEPFAVKGKQGLFNIFLPEGCIECSVSTRVLEDGTTSREKIVAETTRHIQVTESPSGSLYRYLKNVKLKSGEIASYPRIQCGRDPNNLNHWYWGYNYKILESGEWRTKSLSVSRVRVAGVRHMIENNAPITAIKAFIKVLEDDNADSLEREFDEVENNYKKVLEDDSSNSLERPQASGSLYRYLKNKKLKSGAIASYPAVIGVRSPDNPNHWYWGYSYEVLEDREWKGRSLSVPRHKVAAVQAMIDDHKLVNEIKAFIEGEKVNCA